MSYEVPGFVLGTLVAGDDLSAKQYRFVVGTAGDNVGLATAAAVCMGVLQNSPAEGDVCSIMVNGVSKVVCDDPVTEFARVEVGNEGGCMAIASGKGVGWALEAGVEGQVVPVLLMQYGT